MTSRPADSLPQDDDPSTFMPFKTGSGHYDPAAARAFFKAFGKKEEIASGTVIFVENEKSKKQMIFEKRIDKALTTPIDRELFRARNIHRMYLLTRGKVTLSAGGRPLDMVWPGDVFGEMAVLSEIPDMEREARRSATAQAAEDCTAYSLDGDEVQAGLAKQPDFAFMLMSVMFERLRFLAARLAARSEDAEHYSNQAEPVFDIAALTALQERLERPTVVRFNEGARIMRAGNPGASMYIVLEGRVAVAIGRRIVEKLEPGAVFGEMALVDQSPRTATAVARTDCALLSINREGLNELIAADPAIGMGIMRTVAQRLRYMNSLF